MKVMFNIYIQAEAEELQDIAADLESEITPWLSEKDTGAQLLADCDENNVYSRVGINMQVRKRADLKEPLSFLYKLAKSHKCDFVLGVYDGDQQEDICYFGHEEGKPDAFEVANYIGLI
jgi:hypothetical protein